jgi:hypothetical protein
MNPIEPPCAGQAALTRSSARSLNYRRFIGLLAAAILLAASSAPAAAAADESKRFILFNAEYNSTLKQVSKTTVFVEKRLWKIDTRTGETWILIDVLQDGQDIRYWKKITEKPED